MLLSRIATAAEPTVVPTPPQEAPSPTTIAEKNTGDRAMQDARLKALEERIAALSARVDAQDAALKEHRAAPAQPAQKPISHWYDSLKLSGYAQAQLEFHQDSEDQLAVGGQPLNQNRFLIRRARIKAESNFRYAQFLLELDGNTVRGPSFGLQRAEVGAVYRGADAPVDKAPLVGVTAGLILPPFGRQLPESPRLRPFMERTAASRAFFPSEPDIGAMLSGKLGFFEYAVAVINGEPAGQPAGFPLRDPNSAKDVVGRLGVSAEVSSVVKASGGVSLLNGTSTFRGTDGTKPVLTWTDLNEDGQLSNVELSATPGSAPSRSSNFKHWAINVDAGVAVKTGLGQSELQGEVVIANNMDRGLFISDPITSGHDDRQLGYYVGLLQDIGRHAIVGVRYDYYDPRADVFTTQNGKTVPTRASMKTWSPLVGFRLPDGIKLYGQWDIVRDHLVTDERGVPADRKNNAVTIRLQGEL
jgi:hypothetical protein